MSQESADPAIPINQASVRFINTAPCKVTIRGTINKSFNLTLDINKVNF